MVNKIEICKLQKRSEEGFNYLLDYIWKSEHIIDYELDIEREKCKTYFGDDINMKKIRWAMESHKITKIFPYFIVRANLSFVASFLETRLLLLCKICEQTTSKKVTDYKGNGFNRYKEYLTSEFNFSFGKIIDWSQVNAMIKIRNCIVHSNGVLEHIRNQNEIRNLVKTCSFLTKEHREKRRKMEEIIDEVSIIKDEMLGDTLHITKSYPFIACAYSRNFFRDLSKRILQNK